MKKYAHMFFIVILCSILSITFAFNTSADGELLLAQLQMQRSQPAKTLPQRVALAPMVQSLTITPTVVSVGIDLRHGGGGTPSTTASALGTITLSAPAASSGTVVNLGSSNPGVTVPANITLPAGSTTIQFAITVAATAQPGNVTISAINAVSSGDRRMAKSAILTVLPITQVTGMLMWVANYTPGLNDDPCLGPKGISNVMPGYVCIAQVNLDGKAPPGGLKVNFSSSSGSVTTDSSVTVPAGSYGATFHFKVASTATPGQPVSITAVRDISGGVPKTMAVDVKPFQLRISISPTVVEPGGAYTGTVSLGNFAPKAGSTNVALSSSSSSITVPTNVTIPGGAASATFTANVRPTAINGEGVMIGSSMGSFSAQPVMLQVKAGASQVQGIYLPPLYAGNPADGRVDISPATGSPITVNLSSSSPDATVPASVTIAAGQFSAYFTLSTRQSAALGSTITISAIRAGSGNTTKQASTKFELVPVRGIVAPSPIKVGQTVTATVFLEKKAEPGGAVVTITVYENQPGFGTIPKIYLQAPASVTVPAGQTSTTFQVTGSIYDGTKVLIGAKRSGTTEYQLEKFTNLLTINP